MIKFNIPYTSGKEINDLKVVIDSKKIGSNGEYSNKIKAFLNQKYEFKNVYLTPSCTSAIELCVMSLGLGKGDEVIIPSYTFASTPTPFIINGCKIIFADSQKDIPNVCLSSIKSKLSNKTKAVMVVHYGGYSNNISEIKHFCSENNLLLIEDAAQAINAFHNNKPLGSFGDFSVFSFHDTKNVTCGEGGMLIVNNKKYIDKIEKIYQYGTNRSDFLNKKVKVYEWVSLGLSFTLSELSAAFLYSQFLDVGKITSQRKKLWQKYYELLLPLHIDKKITLPQIKVENSNFHNFFILLNNPNHTKKLQNFMKKNEVICTTHFSPLHNSKYSQSHNNQIEELTNTEFFDTHLLRLPLYYDLTEPDVTFISSLIHDFFE